MNSQILLDGFLGSAGKHPSRLALVVGDERLTYCELEARAARVASTILEKEPVSWPLAAVLAQRSVTAYTGILGILGSGKGYVPLNPRFPTERSRKMLLLSGCSVLIVDHQAVAQLPALLTGISRSMTVILPDSHTLPAGIPDPLQHRFVTAGQMSGPGALHLTGGTDPGAVAYLLFTSGSTGEPKGVPISQSNVRSYVSFTANRYAVNENDRFSQMFELTFDLSVHDMFLCWERGACLYCVPESSVPLPAKFIRDNQLTMWFSVPSVAGVLAKMRLLRPGAFPSLRFSLFCGEPLPAVYAQMWQEAAPNSVVENLYGPTETTVAISHYRWDNSRSPKESLHGIVPIGWPFEGQRCRIVDQCLQEVPEDEIGELCLAGSQVTRGYWNNPEKTQQQFVRLSGTEEERWYRTGDLVKRGANGCMFYSGRVDHQVKIRGFRVELQEIELVLRKLCGTEQVVCIPGPVNNGGAEGVIAFASGGSPRSASQTLKRCREVLPEYMVPRAIHWLEEMPLNANGKVDRKKLIFLSEGR